MKLRNSIYWPNDWRGNETRKRWNPLIISSIWNSLHHLMQKIPAWCYPTRINWKIIHYIILENYEKLNKKQLFNHRKQRTRYSVFLLISQESFFHFHVIFFATALFNGYFTIHSYILDIYVLELRINNGILWERRIWIAYRNWIQMAEFF